MKKAIKRSLDTKKSFVVMETELTEHWTFQSIDNNKMRKEHEREVKEINNWYLLIPIYG
jgi:hypothetical protein